MKTFTSRNNIHFFVFQFGLALLVCSLPLSRFMLSISQFLLLLNWLIEGNFTKKMMKLRKNPSVILFISLFLLYCIGFFYSDNHPLALQKIKNTLSVLILPVIIVSSGPLSGKYTKTVLLLFACSVTCAAGINLIHYLFVEHIKLADLEQMHFFMSHIRFSLHVNLAIFIFGFYGAIRNNKFRYHEHMVYLILAVSLIVFLFFLGSLTGVIVLICLLLFSLVTIIIKSGNKIHKIIFTSLIGLCFAGLAAGFSISFYRNFHVKSFRIEDLETQTANGNVYSHNVQKLILENGNVVDIYICDKELRKEWNRISHISYDSLDRKGQLVSHTLIRYLTSKNLRKDSLGIHQLKPEDVVSVENGTTNYRFNTSSYLFKRTYETLWEIDIYRKTGYAQDHSFAQRLAFYKVALMIFKENVLFGVGSGDVRQTMKDYAANNNILFQAGWEGKPHNQFVFFLLAFGITGFAWVIVSWIVPVISQKKYKEYLFNAFLIISTVSMLSVDVLESYDNIVFFAFFYSFLVWPNQGKQNAT